LLAAIVDTTALLKVVVYSVVLGVGVTCAFSVSIFGMVRFDEMRRNGRLPAASFFAIVVASTLAISVGAIVLGISELVAN
jgi:hypothetical protein